MKITGRNKLAGKVVNIVTGMVTCEVEIETKGGDRVVGVVTKGSVEEMDIKVGDEITALVKATSVMFIK
ncbi:MAG: TOBE domain-containing protein [Andreesenia angusta]|nr:TOBE domain-containing protein [Andreesenia angusta]